MFADDGPFRTSYSPERAHHVALARRPILARAVRADVITPTYGPVLLWGEPRIGKTTLVRQILWSLEPERYLVARLPAGVLAEAPPAIERFAVMLADQIGVQLPPGVRLPPAVVSGAGLPAAIDACASLAQAHDRLFVLAIEGLDRFAWDELPGTARENLAHICAHLPDISLLFTSRLPLWRLEGVPMPQDVRVHFVPPLDTEEARRLLTAPVRAQFEFAAGGLTRLLDAAGGRPLLLQIIGRNCQRVLAANGASRVGDEEAAEVMRSCWLAGEHIFKPLLGCQEEGAQQVLAALAGAPAATASSVFAQARDDGYLEDIEALEYELGRLKVWRLVQWPASDMVQLTSAWLGTYLRAGRARSTRGFARV
jgi:hypothetical protein